MTLKDQEPCIFSMKWYSIKLLYNAIFFLSIQDNFILMTVLAGEAVKKRNELSDGDLVGKCMNTLRKIFTGEVSGSYFFCFLGRMVHSK